MIIGMSGLVFYWSLETTIRIRDWIMPSTGINRALVYGVAPVGMFFLVLYAIRNFVRDVKDPGIHPEEEVTDI
jgi:TRAP-type C4-dicarboxylate transport system permease small subunit